MSASTEWRLLFWIERVVDDACYVVERHARWLNDWVSTRVRTRMSRLLP